MRDSTHEQAASPGRVGVPPAGARVPRGPQSPHAHRDLAQCFPKVLHEVRFTPALAEELMQLLRTYRFTALPATNSEHAIAKAVDAEWTLLCDTLTQLGRALDRHQSAVLDSGILEAMDRLKITAGATSPHPPSSAKGATYTSPGQRPGNPSPDRPSILPGESRVCLSTPQP